MNRRTSAACLILPALLAVGCGKPPDGDGRFVRLIDRLDKDHIRRSPRPESRVPEAQADLPALRHSSPLIDAGIGSNPLELKRKLRLGGSERNVLLAPAGSEYAFPVHLTDTSVLEFGIGVRRSDQPGRESEAAAARPPGIRFLVTLEVGGRSRILFQKSVEIPARTSETDAVFTRHVLDLAYPRDDARLVLKTQGEPDAAAFWVNPVLFDRTGEPRGVILISIDTLRADHLGCYGYGRPTTPHIDALAGEGVLFERTYASSPWTLPSHVSMLTGLHGPHHQVYRDDERMDPELTTLADRLREAGFATGAITGGGFVSAAYGFSKGFDSYDESAGGVHRQDSAARVFRAAAEWLERHHSRDFFLFLHTYQPHSPYACPLPQKVMFLDDDSLFGHADLIGHLGGKDNLYRPLPAVERKNLIDLYDGEVRYTDDELVGPLLVKLRELGLYDRCLIVLTSDHGEEFFDHGGWGHGHSLYDEALRVPLIVKFPGGRFAGERKGPVVALVDILPTVCRELGIDPGGGLDGRGLLPVIRGRERGDRNFVADVAGHVLNSHVPQKIAVNQGRRKLILNRPFDPADLEFFAFSPPETEPLELYDLGLDPGETRNIVHQDRDLSSLLVERIRGIFDRAAKRRTGKAEVDEKLREQLRNLGYIR